MIRMISVFNSRTTVGGVAALTSTPVHPTTFTLASAGCPDSARVGMAGANTDLVLLKMAIGVDLLPPEEATVASRQA